MYLISLPCSPSTCFGKSLNSYDQIASASSKPLDPFTTCESTFSPSANKLTVIVSGRLPSWLFVSFQILVPERLTVSISRVFVIVVPSTLEV